MSVSVHEHLARARKVMAIVVVIPAGVDEEENALIADALGRLSKHERRVVAAAAKVNEPSDETWRLVVEQVGKRAPACPRGIR